MCTLTYLPQKNGDFLLTSNRDESPLRAIARHPEIRDVSRGKILFPVDGKAGGTWIATSNDRRAVCLLNGAFVPYKMGGTYRLSRGVMVLQSFEYSGLDVFAAEYDFDGMEPFTFVGIDYQENKVGILELRWDGTALHQRIYNPKQAHIWSSVQLYKPEIIVRRETWFQEWLKKHPTHQLEDVQNFHQFGGEGDVYHDIRMNRDNRVRTVSTTAIESRGATVRMHYADLLTGEKAVANLDVVQME